MTVDRAALRAEVLTEVEWFHRVFPPPYRLSPNLELALRAVRALEEAEAERDAVAITAERMTEYARKAEAQVRAVREVHARGPLSEVWGPGTWPIPGDIPVCQHCTTEDGMDIVRWPCDTIRALED